MDSLDSPSKRKNEENSDDDDGFEIPKEHLRMAKKRLKINKPEALIQKSQSKTTMAEVRNLLLWVLTESHGTIPRWCMVRNKNLVESMTVILTPFIDRHTLFDSAGNSAGISTELPFFSHSIRGSLIPMASVPFGRYPSVCPVLGSLLSAPVRGSSANEWVDKLSDNEPEIAPKCQNWTISDFLMSEENCRANDIPELLPGGRVPPGWICAVGKSASCVKSDEPGHFLDTPESLRNDPDFPNLFGIDCEMVDTIVGKELARVSLVDCEGRVVYDSIVLPENEITDYLTQYSGITAKMIRECKKKFIEAQRDLLRLIGENSILVGHAIDNDLKCLKLIHNRIIDTSDIFPHPNGHPSKHSLVFLLSRVLRETLNRESGHDSVDDARCALKIAMKKLNRGFDYNPLTGGSNKQVPLGTLIDGNVHIHNHNEAHVYKLDGCTVVRQGGCTEVQPDGCTVVANLQTPRLAIHVLTQFQDACENNAARKDALIKTDAAIREIIAKLPDNNIVLVLSGCGDIHTLKKFEGLLPKCQDDAQRIETTKAIQRAKDRAVSAFTIVSTVGELPEIVRGNSNH